MTAYYTVIYREYPKAEIKTQHIYAACEEHAKLLIKYENEVTHNQIEFIELSSN